MDLGYKKSPAEYHFGSTHLWRWLVFNGAMGRRCRFQIPELIYVHQLVSRWMKLEMIMGNGDMTARIKDDQHGPDEQLIICYA